MFFHIDLGSITKERNLNKPQGVAAINKRQAEIVMHYIRRLASGPAAEQEHDGQLLERFALRRDEAAFAALLDRHGAMVLRVCRRVLKKQLKPVVGREQREIDRLIRQLDDDKFAVREAAMRELARVVELAEPLLLKALEENPSLELRRRIEQLLEALAGPLPSPERVRQLRMLELLEQIGTKEAEELLTTLAGGDSAPPWRSGLFFPALIGLGAIGISHARSER